MPFVLAVIIATLLLLTTVDVVSVWAARIFCQPNVLCEGTEEDDVISIVFDTGQGGELNIRAKGGNDFISGWFEDDIINGGPGNDIIYPYTGNDIVEAGSGNDLIDGYNGHDALYGGDGNDDISGFDGYDHIVGGQGSDRLYGGRDGDDIEAYVGVIRDFAPDYIDCGSDGVLGLDTSSGRFADGDFDINCENRWMMDG